MILPFAATLAGILGGAALALAFAETVGLWFDRDAG